MTRSYSGAAAVGVLWATAAGCSFVSLEGLQGGDAGAVADGGGDGGHASTSDTAASTSTSAGGTGAVTSSGTGGGAVGELTILAAPGLGGDGFLSWPPPGLCGETVTDWYPRDPYKIIDVGRDPPCSVDVSYRAFVRFDLSGLAGVTLEKAAFRFFYLQKAKPNYPVRLFRVDDAGPIADIYWNASNHEDLGQVLDPSTGEVQWIEVDATNALAAALAGGEGFLVLKFQYDNEQEDPGTESRWYDIVSSDSDTNQAERLVVTYSH